jgi:hypothetical protein
MFNLRPADTVPLQPSSGKHIAPIKKPTDNNIDVNGMRSTQYQCPITSFNPRRASQLYINRFCQSMSLITRNITTFEQGASGRSRSGIFAMTSVIFESWGDLKANRQGHSRVADINRFITAAQKASSSDS